MVKSQLVQGESAKVSVNLNQEQLKQLREQVKEALEEARDADGNSGFWGDIGDALGGDIGSLAEVVAVAAAVAASGGTAAIVLGAIAVACTLASKYADELGIPPKVAIGIGIAAAVSSVLSGNFAASGQVAAAAGASQAAAAVGNGAAQVSKATHVLREIAFAAKLTAAGANGTGAIANGVSAYYHSDALNHDADAHQVQSRETLTSMDIDAAVEVLSRSIDRQLSLSSATAQTLQANQQSTHLIIQGLA
jgi:hypothetical protein